MANVSRSLHALTNPDGSVDNRFPLGNKPLVQPSSLGIDFTAFAAAGINLQNRPQNTGISINYRQYLTGTSASTATLTVNAITGTLGNWGFDTPTDTNLTNLATVSGSGSLQVVADDGAGHVVSFPVQSWSILAPVQQKALKWNPGHYGASAGKAKPGDLLTKFSPEMDDMLKDDWIQGYRLFVNWASVDEGPLTFTGTLSAGATSGMLTTAPHSGNTSPTGSNQYYTLRFSDGSYRDCTVSGTSVSWAGTGAHQGGLADNCTASVDAYKFTLLDGCLNRCKTQYSRPKQLALTLLVMSFSGGTRNSGDYSVIPFYITQSVATYGPSPDGSSSGWWGPPVGSTAGAYSAAVYRTAVANRYGLMGKAVMDRYNSDPNFEALIDQEPSAVTNPANNYAPRDSTYAQDDSNYVAAMKSYLAVWRAAGPNTSIISENTWLRTVQPTQDFEIWMMTGGLYIAPGSADCLGQAYYNVAGHNPGYNWGLMAYAGIQASGSNAAVKDQRGFVRPMLDVEGPDIASRINSGGYGTLPSDIVAGSNITLKASHLFWCHIPADSTITWSQVTAALRDNPLTNTGYPGNYP